MRSILISPSIICAAFWYKSFWSLFWYTSIFFSVDYTVNIVNSFATCFSFNVPKTRLYIFPLVYCYKTHYIKTYWFKTITLFCLSFYGLGHPIMFKEIKKWILPFKVEQQGHTAEEHVGWKWFLQTSMENAICYMCY